MDLQHEHYLIVQHILRNTLPANIRVWVFGSRAHKTKKAYSDLDLLIDIGKTMPLELLADLRHQFDESDLPFKVDIADWNSVDASFKKRVNTEKVEFEI